MMDTPGGDAYPGRSCEHCCRPRSGGAGIAGRMGVGNGRLAIVSGVAFALSLLGMMAGAPRESLLVLQGIAIVSGGGGVARRAWTSICNRRVDINVLMSVTVAGAIAIGEWTEGAAIAFLFTVSELLESRTVSRARRSIEALLDVAPREASLLRDGAWIRVPAQSLGVGDVILIRPGEKVAADGSVLNGRSAVDQSPITGESLPVEKTRGDRVYAGSINREGALEVIVSRLPEDSTLARIIHLVKEAEERKAPVQQFVDRFAHYYTPTVIMTAAAVAFAPPLAGAGPVRHWFFRGLALLAASCPCALVVSTPVSIVSAITNAARHGVLVKGGAHLESLGRTRAFAFDKTGTLTVGRLTVSRVAPFNGVSEDRVLSYAAGIESRSEHPIAQAIVAEARRRGTNLKSATDFLSIPGMGASASVDGRTHYLGNAALLERAGVDAGVARDLVDEAQAQGGTVTLLGMASSGDEAGRLLGAIVLGDTLRPESAAVVSELRSIGIEHIVMVTGDNRGAAVFVGDAAGVDEMEWELLPAEKVGLIQQLSIRYRDVAMVGDGINDAPALAAATVGIAMGVAGSDAALETADIALMGDDLSRIPFMVRLSRRTLSVIRQNVVIALAMKLLSIALIFTGATGLWMAVVADMGSSTLVTLNAMRLALGRGGR